MVNAREKNRERFRRIADESLEAIRLCSFVLDDLSQGISSFRLYENDHKQAVECTNQLLKSIRSLFFKRRIFTIDVGIRRFLVNSLPIYEAGTSSQELHQQFINQEIGGITFIEGVDQKQTTILLRFLSKAKQRGAKRDWIAGRLAESGVTNIQLEIPLLDDMPRSRNSAAADDDADGSFVQSARVKTGDKIIFEAPKLYQVAVGFVKDMLYAFNDPNMLNIRDVTRLAKNIVYLLQERPHELVALALFGRIDNYQYRHPVNVAIFAPLMAQHLLKDPRQLVELARIALIYDVGKGDIHNTLLQKNSELTEEEHDLLAKHPVISADILDRHTEIDKLAVVVAFEHHLEGKGKGYPDTSQDRQTNLITWIIRTIEAFDSNIGNDIHRKTVSPQIAFQRLRESWKGRPEQVLLVRLIEAIGIFPAGSFVKLASGEVGMVIKQNAKKLANPWITVVFDSNGELKKKSPPIKAEGARQIVDTLSLDVLPVDPLAIYPFTKA